MENTYFKGLDKALDDNCYIIVYNEILGNAVALVKKKNTETGMEESVLSVEAGNVIAALNTASYKIDEAAYKKDVQKIVWLENINKVLDSGYTLHFYKLPSGQVLSTICCYGDIASFDYIPVKSIMSNDVRAGLELLNVSLECFKGKHDSCFYDNLFNFVVQQTDVVKAYKRSLKSNSK